jgi:DNA-binding YbaB/EbfC family protein|tara:strand:+ start:2910 stop:3239 length:330 start_codon:yes stop_codon:yes gene_type:complete
MFDMMKMMGKIKEAQEKMKLAQSELNNIKVCSESGAGMVKVEVNGKKEVISIDIDDGILNDKDMIQDLIVAATNKALFDVDIKIKDHMKSKTGDIFPNIPGFDIGNMFK